MKIDIDIPDDVWIIHHEWQSDGVAHWSARWVPVMSVTVYRNGDESITVNRGTEEHPLEWVYSLNQLGCPDWFHTKEAAETAIKYHYTEES